MALDAKQQGVLRGMVAGAVVALAVTILGAWLDPFSFYAEPGGMVRLDIAIQASLVPALFLAICIGRLAKHRFFTPEDIDGGGLTHGTDKATLLQSLLQNTLEQSVLATISYCAWAVVMPFAWLSVVPLAAIVFAIGRILFFAGYKHGAPSRAMGFTLSFYPSVIMLASAVFASFVLPFFG